PADNPRRSRPTQCPRAGGRGGRCREGRTWRSGEAPETGPDRVRTFRKRPERRRQMADWRDQFLADIRESFALQRKLAERAIAQLDDEQLFRTAGPEDNSVAVIMKHV